MKVTAEVHFSQGFETFVKNLSDPRIQQAAAQGLNEHAQEQRRLSVTSISAYTGVPKGRVGGKTKVIRAAPGAQMEVRVQTADAAISLAEYGSPVWVRDLSPIVDGKFGGSVSSMRGAQATGWNVRRIFPHSFIANGQVVVRTTSEPYPLKRLSMAVLANELAKPSRPNVPAAERYAAIDLEQRVIRHVIRALGT